MSDGILSEAEAAHHAALLMPYPRERPMANLINAIDGLVALNGTTDPQVNDAVARLILGTDLLIQHRGPWGRFDLVALHQHLDALAKRVGLDLATRKITKKGPSINPGGTP